MPVIALPTLADQTDDVDAGIRARRQPRLWTIVERDPVQKVGGIIGRLLIEIREEIRLNVQILSVRAIIRSRRGIEDTKRNGRRLRDLIRQRNQCETVAGERQTARI